MKCSICKNNPVLWAWQPLGPAENADCFTSLGYHYRGFAVYKVCDSCRASIKTGTPFQFEYKGITYAGNVDHVEPVVSVLKHDAEVPHE